MKSTVYWDITLWSIERQLTAHKPLCWFHYVDDTFLIWSYEPDRLRNFHLNIQFTIEMETDGSLGHEVYRKPTHNNLYLNSSSHHHPSNKHAILSTLVNRARALGDQDSLHEGLVFMGDIFRQTGYIDGQIWRTSVAFLPYVRSIFNCIGRVLSLHNIKSVSLPPRKISSFLWSSQG
jgi:hypothetical protein